MRTFFVAMYGISIFQILYGGINYLQGEVIDPLPMVISGAFLLIVMMILNFIFDRCASKSEKEKENV